MTTQTDNKEKKELVNKRFWSLEQWKTGNDIERLVWFISTLSPHNLWRAEEAINDWHLKKMRERENEAYQKGRKDQTEIDNRITTALKDYCNHENLGVVRGFLCKDCKRLWNDIKLKK